MADSTFEAGKQQQSESSTTHPPKRRFVGIVAVSLFVVLIAAAVTWHESARTEDASSQRSKAASTPDVVEVTPEQLQQIKVEPVSEQDIETDLETTGKVGFNEDRMTPVFPPYGGRVLELFANKGDLVKAEQPLLVIESPDLVATINDLSAARADADKAKINLDIADKAVQRARRLNAQEALATKELQAAESDFQRAREDDRRAEAAISVVRNRLALFGKSAAEIAAIENSVTDQIDRRIVIRAPLAGTIVDRKVGPGQYVKPDAADPLYLISDLSSVWVNADVYENALSQIRVGAPVEITVAAFPEKRFPARISAINPTVDATTRTVHVRCIVPNPDRLLKPEMFATIRIGQTTTRTRPTVPTSAVLTQGTSSFVLFEESPGRFRRHEVKAGREIHGYTIVEDGLHTNDRVVTSGALLLGNGLAGK